MICCLVAIDEWNPLRHDILILYGCLKIIVHIHSLTSVFLIAFIVNELIVVTFEVMNNIGIHGHNNHPTVLLWSTSALVSIADGLEMVSEIESLNVH